MLKPSSHFLALLIGLTACGEPIEPGPPKHSTEVRTLPVVASPRVYEVGEAFRVSIVMTAPSQGLTERSQFVDVVTGVTDGRLTQWDRHMSNGSVHSMKADSTERPDFAMFEQLLPPRTGDVPEAWHAEGVFGALCHGTVLREFPETGGEADCRLKSVLVDSGRSTAIISVEIRVKHPQGPVVLTGRIVHDLKEKLLVKAELDGTVAGDKVSIRATRALTKFIPPQRD